MHNQAVGLEWGLMRVDGAGQAGDGRKGRDGSSSSGSGSAGRSSSSSGSANRSSSLRSGGVRHCGDEADVLDVDILIGIAHLEGERGHYQFAFRVVNRISCDIRSKIGISILTAQFAQNNCLFDSLSAIFALDGGRF